MTPRNSSFALLARSSSDSLLLQLFDAPFHFIEQPRIFQQPRPLDPQRFEAMLLRCRSMSGLSGPRARGAPMIFSCARRGTAITE